MGNKVRPNPGPVSTTTSVRIEVELFMAARRKGINLSSLMNQALRAVLKKEDDDLTEEQIAALNAERARRIENAIEKNTVEDIQTMEAALQDIQTRYNVYLAAAPASTREAKLFWVAAKKEQQPLLRTMADEAILAELEGE